MGPTEDKPQGGYRYSTVTVLARFRGWSTFNPFARAMAYAKSWSGMFAVTGVTHGDYLNGVRFFRGGATTNSVVMRSRTHTVRFLNSMHRFDLKPEY